jgi:maleate cis-trans isomerase
VWRKVESTQDYTGGVAVLREKASELDSSAKRATSILDSVEQTLQQVLYCYTCTCTSLLCGEYFDRVNTT